jgi:citrate lyase subunit beta/citryl-CoA lyase
MTSPLIDAESARLARSLLFVPGDRPDRFAKAEASRAHQVIYDLEDAVAPGMKDSARNAVFARLGEGASGVVRINAADTEWFADDLALLKSLPRASVMLPKADAASAARTAEALGGRPVIALIETASAVLDVAALASMNGVARIAFGSIDFSTDSGIADEGEAMTPVRVQIVLASRAAGLPPPIDGVSVEFKDPALMREHALKARRLGFGGKLCIHPAQVAAIEAAFRPTSDELAWAARVLGAFEASGGAATAVDGKMVDKPVVERARRIVSEARTLASPV